MKQFSGLLCENSSLFEYNKNYINELDTIFCFAAQEKFIAFVNGGFAIALADGKISREHNDIDLMVEEKDFEIWKKWFIERGFEEKHFRSKSPDYAVIMDQGDIHIDLGSIYFLDEKVFDHADGYNKPYDWQQTKKQLILSADINGVPYYYINPETALYFKTSSTKIPRQKDIHDIEILKRIVN